MEDEYPKTDELTKEDHKAFVVTKQTALEHRCSSVIDLFNNDLSDSEKLEHYCKQYRVTPEQVHNYALTGRNKRV